jgi:ribosomal protein L20
VRNRSSWFHICAVTLAAHATVSLSATVPADISVTEPPIVSPEQFKTRLHSFLTKHQSKGALASLADVSAGDDADDMHWQLQQLVSDKKESLANLRDVGIIPRADGSVELDLRSFPELMPVDVLLLVETPEDVAAYAPALKERGFEDEDFKDLTAYLAQNDRHRMIFRANRPYVEQYAKLVRSAKSISVAAAKAHNYRIFKSTNRVNRTWVNNLLASLRPRARRIFQSTLEESVAEGGIVIGPDNVSEEAIAREVSFLKSNAFEAAMSNQEKEFAK